MADISEAVALDIVDLWLDAVVRERDVPGERARGRRETLMECADLLGRMAMRRRPPVRIVVPSRDRPVRVCTLDETGQEMGSTTSLRITGERLQCVIFMGWSGSSSRRIDALRIEFMDGSALFPARRIIGLDVTRGWIETLNLDFESWPAIREARI